MIAAQGLMSHGRPQEAGRYLQAAEQWLSGQIAADPDYTAHRYWMAQTLYSQGRWGDAEIVLEELRLRSPNNANYLGFSAVVAAHLRRDGTGMGSGGRRRLARGQSNSAALHGQDRRLGDLDRAFADQSGALPMGISGFPWTHSGDHHEIALMKQDPRIARLLPPIAGEN